MNTVFMFPLLVLPAAGINCGFMSFTAGLKPIYSTFPSSQTDFMTLSFQNDTISNSYLIVKVLIQTNCCTYNVYSSLKAGGGRLL